MKVTGKCSSFGGPDDMGVSPSEGLAFIYEVDDKPELFLPEPPPGTTGLARRLDPEKFYIACRWDYSAPWQSKTDLLLHKALVRSIATGRQFLAYPADWGPHEDTGRVADLSPGLMAALGIETDDEVTVTYPFGQEEPVAIHHVAISAGHGKKVAGASGLIEENVETPKVMARVANELRRRGITTVQYWDQTSTTQNDNLEAIVDWHNDQERELDVSVHFNSSDGTGHGVEVLYLTQAELAAKVSAAVAQTGLTDRGAKFRDNLAFLNGTDKPAILIETCFVDNAHDVEIYSMRFADICANIAAAIAGVAAPVRPSRPGRPRPPEAATPQTMVVALTVPEGVELVLTINGQRVLLD